MRPGSQAFADVTDLSFAGSRLTHRYRVDGDGPPVVLIHGVGVNLTDTEALAAVLRRDFRVLRYDLRGHGGSAKLPGPYSLTLFSDDLVELMDGVGFDVADVVGFSLGGMIAQRFALDHPDRLRRLGLVSAVAGRTAEEQARMAVRAADVARGGAGLHLASAVERWFTDAFRKAHPEIVEARRRRTGGNDPACYVAAYRVLAGPDLADELPRIRHPTIVITGEHDQGSSPRMARLMHERIAGSVLHVLPGLRHALLLEAPELLGGLLREFLLR